MATRKFVDEFNLACAHYGFTEAEKVEATICARAHMDDAEACFSAQAIEIGPEAQPAMINEWVVDSAEAQRKKESKDERSDLRLKEKTK